MSWQTQVSIFEFRHSSLAVKVFGRCFSDTQVSLLDIPSTKHTSRVKSDCWDLHAWRHLFLFESSAVFRVWVGVFFVARRVIWMSKVQVMLLAQNLPTNVLPQASRLGQLCGHKALIVAAVAPAEFLASQPENLKLVACTWLKKLKFSTILIHSFFITSCLRVTWPQFLHKIIRLTAAMAIIFQIQQKHSPQKKCVTEFHQGKCGTLEVSEEHHKPGAGLLFEIMILPESVVLTQEICNESCSPVTCSCCMAMTTSSTFAWYVVTETRLVNKVVNEEVPWRGSWLLLLDQKSQHYPYWHYGWGSDGSCYWW